MHVGCSIVFQNPFGLSDAEVYEQELRLAELVEPLGFDSIWTVEHHFTDYTLCPDPVQFLTWMAARTSTLKLGTSVIVLPWHDPMRVAEAVTMLDNLSGGRLILGIGRGLARVEYEGFRVDMDTSRERFVAYAQVVLEGLERGYLEYDGELLHQPRRDIRPRPHTRSAAAPTRRRCPPSRCRSWPASASACSSSRRSRGSMVQEDFEVYRRVWAEENPDTEPPPPLSGGFIVVHENADRAEELARRYIGGYYGTVLQHYEFAADPHKGVQGYEFYTHVTRYIERHGASGAIDAFVDLMPFGTPDQVLEKVAFIRDAIGIAGFLPNFSFAGMPYDEAERSLRLFATEVMPELQRWDSPPVGEAVPATLAVG